MITKYDLLLRNITIFDGNGEDPFVGDVGISGDKIAFIGDAGAAVAGREIDGGGLALAPGFIDVHTHDDFAPFSHPDMSFKTRGGVTTCIVGNCGFGAAPFAAARKVAGGLLPLGDVTAYEGHGGYAKAVAACSLGANIAVLAGHGTFRMSAMGRDDRVPDDKEMREMKNLLNEALDAGVFGLSTGLIYEPGRYAALDEVAELAAEMKGTRALYTTHMRDEGPGLVSSVKEAIEIGKRAGVPVQISHHKAAGRANWGLVSRSLAEIEAAQARGENVHADQYPYTAGSTKLVSVMQNGALSEVSDGSGDAGIASARPEDIVIASAPDHSQWEGKSIADLAQSMDLTPHAAAEKIIEKAPGTSVVLHMMSEKDVQTVLRHPSTMIGSDGIPTLDGKPHPRLYNSFARVLGHYSRDLKLLSLAVAVHRMTGMSADKFGLVGRGRIVVNHFADLVLFDANRIIDKGTYQDPNQYPDGIYMVIVNGRPVVEQDKVIREKAGSLLCRSDNP
jgi:N-acyl-D-amino-acid deacylase